MKIKNSLQDERGASAIEYGLIAGGIALAICAAAFLAGESLVSLFDAMVASLAGFVDDIT